MTIGEGWNVDWIHHTLIISDKASINRSTFLSILPSALQESIDPSHEKNNNNQDSVFCSVQVSILLCNKNKNKKIFPFLVSVKRNVTNTQADHKQFALSAVDWSEQLTCQREGALEAALHLQHWLH